MGHFVTRAEMQSDAGPARQAVPAGKRALAESLRTLESNTGRSFDALLTQHVVHSILLGIGGLADREQLILRGSRPLDAWLGRASWNDVVELGAAAGSDSVTIDQLMDRALSGCRVDSALAISRGAVLASPPGSNEIRSWVFPLAASLARHRARIRVIVSVGAPIAPALQEIAIPSPTGQRAARLLACPRETTVAEAAWTLLEALDGEDAEIALSELRLLASHFRFDGASLGQALEVVFRARKTPLPRSVPERLACSGPLQDHVEIARRFLDPPLARMTTGLPPAMAWPPGGPWEMTGHWRYG